MTEDALSNEALAHSHTTSVQEFHSGRRADVLIIGGGIGGLAASVNLRRKGFTVKLYERLAEFGEVGAGLQIASNCTRILDDMGLLEEVKGLGFLPDRMVMRDAVTAEHVPSKAASSSSGVPQSSAPALAFGDSNTATWLNISPCRRGYCTKWQPAPR